MEISVRPHNVLHGLVILLISTVCKTGGASSTAPCNKIQVSNTKSHPAEEGLYHLSPSATCDDNAKWIWSMKERENYIYYSSEPPGWRIGAVVCRGNKAALYSEGAVETPFDTKPGSWKEWTVDTNNWGAIDLRVTCVDGRQPDAEAPIKQDDNMQSVDDTTSVGRFITYVVIVVVIIGCLFMFQRKKQKTHHIL